MTKNDITYEYRVFTHKLIDVEAMEVGICTSKIVKELKTKDKVDGRFFHTSDTDEWFFCWNGELQKLNLKGNADVNAALAEVERLISEANVAVADAKKTAADAKDAANAAKEAADSATAAVESIENKADKSDVESLANVVETKADSAVVESLSAKVDAIKVPSLDGYATEKFVGDAISAINIPEVPTKVSQLENDVNYLTEHQDISGKQDIITDLDTIRSGAALGATALQKVPAEYITEDKLDGKGYLTADIADKKYAPIGSEGVDLSDYATKDFVEDEIKKIFVPTKVSELDNDLNYLTEHQDISGKQDIITDLDTIRSGAALGATALQSIPDEYVTEKELDDKGYLTEHQDISGKQDVITDLNDIRANATKGANALQSLDNYFTKEEINALIGEAVTITNTILGE